MKTKLGQLNPSVSSYRSKRDQRDKDVAVPGIKRKKAIPGKTPEKDSTQKGQTENYGKVKYEFAESKEEVSGSGAHKTEEVCERNRRKLKEVREMSAKTKESSLSQDV